MRSGIPRIGIYKVGPMGEDQKECRECGWRGLAAELDETSNPSTGEIQIFCPDCGGEDFENLNPDQQQ